MVIDICFTVVKGENDPFIALAGQPDRDPGFDEMLKESP
jgi:hypothetical protein